jgi:hypothetical protein
MSLLIVNSAAMAVNREAKTSSFSLYQLIDEAATKYRVDPAKIAAQYEKLFPGRLPTLNRKRG